MAEVKDKGAVNGFKSVTPGGPPAAAANNPECEPGGRTDLYLEGEGIYDFVPTKVESSNPNFIGHLSDYLGRVTEIPGTRSIWIREQNNTGD